VYGAERDTRRAAEMAYRSTPKSRPSLATSAEVYTAQLCIRNRNRRSLECDGGLWSKPSEVED